MKTNFVFLLLLFFSIPSLQAQKIRPKKEGERYIFVNRKGKNVFKERYDDAKWFKNGLAAVSKKGKWGFINEKGFLKIPYKFEDATYFNGSSAIVKSDGKYHLIDEQGTIITEPFDSIFHTAKRYAILQDTLWGIIDSIGGEIVKPKYQNVNLYYDGKMPIKLNNRWGLLENEVENFDNPDILFTRPEISPLFSTECPLEKDYKEQKHCSEMELLQFIYKNIKYPAEARESGIQGTVVIQFIVNEVGQILDPEIVREIGGGCDEESLRVVKAMPKWATPGLQDGKAIRTIFNLPIRFRLE